ncbi:MAG TPA: hypothetical protein VF815_22660 [Myxococcaceae bacterium]|jgi:hypothetical protein
MLRSIACQKTAPNPAAVSPITVAEATGFFSLDSELSLDSFVSSVELREVSFELSDDSPELSDELPESFDESPEPSDELPEFESEFPESEFESEAAEESPDSEANAPEGSTALKGLAPLAPGV